MVVNQVGDVYRIGGVRSERFVMLFDGRNFVCKVDVVLRRVAGVVLWTSRSVLNSLVFAGGYSYKSIEPSHVVGALWR